jgi:NADH/NAD ratio-sensing transcriptional regulator Rex
LNLGRARATIWLGGVEMADGEEARAALDDVHCRLVGVFDDRHRGERVAGQMVHPLAQAPDWVRRRRASVAVLASEKAARPELVEELVAAGIRAVLNLTPAPLESCAQAVIEQGDLRSQLSRLLRRLPAEAGAGKRSS